MIKEKFEFLKSTKEEQDFLDDKLYQFNLSCLASPQKNNAYPLNYCVKNNGNIIGGMNADLYFGEVLYINILFIDEHYRGQNLGTQLLLKVETEAQSLGASLSHLDTFDFQAKDFYLKHGYHIFGVLEDCPKGHKRYYLTKKLD